jgi:hypothetical protein
MDYIIDETNYTGECPMCKFSWDLGELPDYYLTTLDTWSDLDKNTFHLSEYEKLERYRITQALGLDLDARFTNDKKIEYSRVLAREKGWSPENPIRMSSIIHTESSNGVGFAKTFRYHCPNCFSSWDSRTGESSIKHTPLEPVSLIQERLKREAEEKKEKKDE